MKAISFALLFALPLILNAADVKRGDTRSEVCANLGIPRGHLEVGGRELLYFDRGEVELRSGVVIRAALRSQEDQVVFDARRSAETIRVREEQEIRQAGLIVEGEALKARKLTDSAFQASPVAYQVAFWEDFSRRYSKVSSTEELSIARARLAEQVTKAQLQAEQAQRIAELEARVAEAEARTAEANARAFRARGYSRYDGGPLADRPSTVGQITYRFFDAPLPYATSPGMPLREPTYRNDPPSFQNNVKQDNPVRDERCLLQPSNGNQRDSRRYVPDFRRS